VSGVFAKVAVVLATVGLLLVAGPGRAATFIHVDWGDGRTRTITPPPGTINVAPSPYGPGVAVSYFDTGSFVNIDLVGPSGAPFVAGNYEDTDWAPFRAPNRAGMGFGIDGLGCGGLGRFTVREVTFGAGGEVLSLAADFVVACVGNVRGVVRYNSSVPLAPPDPVAVAGRALIVDEGASFTLDGRNSYDADGSIAAFEWRQVSGPAVTLSTPGSATTQWTAPDVPQGGGDVTFELKVTDNDGRSDTDNVTMHVRDVSDARSFMYFKSQPGDYIGQGLTFTLTENDGVFTGQQGLAPGGAAVGFNGNQTGWAANFAAAPGNALTPGTYAMAGRFATPDHPTIDVYGDGRGCNVQTGRFTVLEIQYNGADLEKLAVDYEQHCEGFVPALFGSVRFNSAIPVGPRPPSAYAVAQPRMPEGAVVNLDATSSVDPQDSPLTFQWSQIGGPAAAISNSTSAVASFVAPDVPPGGADLTFRVQVQNGLGLTDAAQVMVHVLDASDARSLLRIDSATGDYIGGGRHTTYFEWEGLFAASPRYGSLANGVAISFNSSSTWWYLDFAPIVGTGPLGPGVYLNAERAPFASPGHPGLDVSGTGAGCNQLTGRFTVLEAVYSGNAIVSFAADFEQHCESSTAPPLFGSIRINSTIPLPARPPSAHVSAPSRALEGRSVTLDSAGSGDPQGGALSYAWTQIAGPSVTITNAQSASASFTAPQVVAGGADLTFRLHVTNSLGLSDAATAVVHVADAADARYVLYLDRRPGYPGYGPPTTTITEFDAQFSRYATANPVDWVGFSAYNSPDYFAGDFVAAAGTALVPGTYANVQTFPPQRTGSPSMAISAFGYSGCGGPGSSFTVLEIGTSNGSVDRFAADFVQYCSGFPNPLYGSVRLNSAIPPTQFPFTQFASQTLTATGMAAVSMSGGGSSCRFVDPHWLAAPPGFGEVPPSLPGVGVTFPHGLLAFATEQCTSGARVTFAIDLPRAVPAGFVYWKYGPTSDNHAPHWYVLPSSISGNRVTFTIEDGGLGDDDLTANGAIVDQGGVGTALAAPPLAVVQVPTLGERALAALCAMMLVLGVIAMRRRLSTSGR